MKRITIITVTMLLSASFLSLKAQDTITWQQLKDVTWKEQYVTPLSGYYSIPSFGKKVTAFENKLIRISGFYMPIDVDGTIFALSETPSTMCFFCGTGGIESVIEIMAKHGYKGFRRIATDKYIQIEGVLKINRDDPNHLMYILTDAQLVKIVK